MPEEKRYADDDWLNERIKAQLHLDQIRADDMRFWKAMMIGQFFVMSAGVVAFVVLMVQLWMGG